MGICNNVYVYFSSFNWFSIEKANENVLFTEKNLMRTALNKRFEFYNRKF